MSRHLHPYLHHHLHLRGIRSQLEEIRHSSTEVDCLLKPGRGWGRQRAAKHARNHSKLNANKRAQIFANDMVSDVFAVVVHHAMLL